MREVRKKDLLIDWVTSGTKVGLLSKKSFGRSFLLTFSPISNFLLNDLFKVSLSLVDLSRCVTLK